MEEKGTCDEVHVVISEQTARRLENTKPNRIPFAKWDTIISKVLDVYEANQKPCGDEEWIPVSQETLKVLNQLRRPKESYDMAINYLIELYETEKILYERLGGKTHDGLGQTSRSETKHGN